MDELFVSASDGSVQGRWLALQGLIDLRIDATSIEMNEAIRAMEQIAQIELPQTANRYVVRGQRAACWMGPSHWLIRLPEHEQSELLARLNECIWPIAATVVSDAYLGIKLTGSGAVRVLSTGCPLDFGQLSPGSCVRSVLARAQVMVIVSDKVGDFELLIDRSHGEYLQQWIAAAVAVSPGINLRGAV